VSQTGKIQLVLSPQAERYVRRDAPVEVRRMAARGALPLAPVELATVLFALLHDPDDEVKVEAERSLAGLPEGVLVPVLEGRTHPALLSYLAHRLRDRAAACERIALNPVASDTTVAFLATLPHRRVVDVIANNQQRMLRAPEIVDALGDNPLTGRATIDRILSFLGFARPVAEVPEAGEDAAADATPPARPEDLSDAEAESVLRSILGDDAGEFAEELVAETAAEPTPELGNNLYALIQGMSVFQKIKLARMGNKEARGLLVRDRNKIVASAAIRSPKITENEIVSFAKMRNVCDEVLRAIAQNRDWTRSYSVKLALATNPKTSPPSAVKFLNYLQERDLRNIMKSKDVPSAISTHARRILSKKGKV
jgi:hypothetical protein